MTECLPNDILRLIFMTHLGVEMPKMFMVCKRFNNLFNLSTKEKIYTIVATYQRRIERRNHTYKRYLASKRMAFFDRCPLIWNDVKLGLVPFVFGVNIPTGFTVNSKYVFNLTHIFCDKCDAVINGNLNLPLFEEYHLDVCKGNLDVIKPLFSRAKKCCVKICPYRTNVCWELSKHEYECKRKLWTCKLCGTQDIATDKTRSHLSLHCQSIKDILERRFDDLHSVLWRQWIESKTYMRFKDYIRFKDRRKRLRKTIKRDLMKEYFKSETFTWMRKTENAN